MSTVRNFFALWFLSRAARRGYKSIQAESSGESLKHAGIAWGEVEIAKRLAQEKKTKKKCEGTDPLEVLFFLLFAGAFGLIILFVKFLGPAALCIDVWIVLLFGIGVIVTGIIFIVSPTPRHKKEQNKQQKQPVGMTRYSDYALGITLKEVWQSRKIVVVAAATRLGLKAGDTITKVNGTRIHHLSELRLSLLNPEQKTATVMRKGRKKTVQFEVG